MHSATRLDALLRISCYHTSIEHLHKLVVLAAVKLSHDALLRISSYHSSIEHVHKLVVLAAG